jgi:iron complex outermembrane receptor protein
MTYLGHIAVVLLCVAQLCAQKDENQPDLSSMSVEDLMNLQVTTAGKIEQKLSQIPSPVYVITAEDIRRSGLTSVPEALRLAPGVEVAQINSSTWAIAIHGFNSRYANKLLVLVDGRTVYSATFTQVFWSIEDLALEDVERIEVIRGPGGSVWGANAVEGVINIITRTAKQSQGGVVSLIAGNHDNAIADVRYGALLGRTGAYRISARYADRSSIQSLAGGSNFDHWNLMRLGSRVDWGSPAKDSFSWQGDLSRSDGGETTLLPALVPLGNPAVSRPVTYSGGNSLFRWEHVLSSASKTALQVYFDRKDVQESTLEVIEQTVDIDFQDQTQFKRNEIVWGTGFRILRQDTEGNYQFAFDPPVRIPKLFSAFAQDQIALRPEKLWLTVGSKLEHNDHTGFEVEPTIRLMWAAHPRHSFWIALSKAVRSPATFERGGHLLLSASPGPGGFPVLAELMGNRDFTSEDLIAYESGYRSQPSKWVSVDLTSFYDVYTHLPSTMQETPFLELIPGPPHLVLPVVFGNALSGRAFGAEATVTYTPATFWKITGSYSWLRTYDLSNPADPQALPSISAGANPSHQTQAHSFLSLSHRTEFDTSVYYVSSLPAQAVPGYIRLDAHLGWSPTQRLELDAGFQNLLAPRHLEFDEPPSPTLPGKIPRSAYGKVVWRF